MAFVSSMSSRVETGIGLGTVVSLACEDVGGQRVQFASWWSISLAISAPAVVCSVMSGRMKAEVISSMLLLRFLRREELLSMEASVISRGSEYEIASER